MVCRLECRRAHVRPDESKGQASHTCQACWYSPYSLSCTVRPSPLLTFLSPQLVLLLRQRLRLPSLAQLVVPQSVFFSIHVSQSNRLSRWNQTLEPQHLHRSPVPFYVTEPSRLTCNTGPPSLVPAPVASRTRVMRPRANTQTPVSDREGDTSIQQMTHVPLRMRQPRLLMTPWLSVRAPN